MLQTALYFQQIRFGLVASLKAGRASATLQDAGLANLRACVSHGSAAMKRFGRNVEQYKHACTTMQDTGFANVRAGFGHGPV